MTQVQTSVEAGPSKIQRKSLSLSIDFSCPINLPPKAPTGHTWVNPHAGPCIAPHESLEIYVRRRYLETLYLPEILSPLTGFVYDLLRVNTTDVTPERHPLVDLIRPLLLSLSQIEYRHRKLLAPLLPSFLAGAVPINRVESIQDSDIKTTTIDHTESLQTESKPRASSGIQKDEMEIMESCINLRLNSRSCVEGNLTYSAKKLGEEFERRETLLQIILLLLYIPHHIPPIKKKRKRDKDRERDRDVSRSDMSTDDPNMLLEVFMDRLSVWLAVAELGIGLSEEPISTKGKITDKENKFQITVKNFWNDILLPTFIPQLPEQCSSFHLKIFGTPIPSKLLPQLTKKRKPKFPPPPPSSDSGTNTTRISIPRPVHRGSSKAPSESSSRLSPPRETRELQRSVSRASERIEKIDDPRSRSRSVDLKDQPLTNKKSLVRAPSGKDMFKGREMIRRTSSIVRRKMESVDSQSRLGLLGRKPIIEGGKEKKMGDEMMKKEKDKTIIFATPSKPRMIKKHPSNWNPTPIQEEPSTERKDRTSFVVETPVNGNRISDIPLSGLTSVDEDDDGSLESEGEEVGLMIPETPAR
ncbi:hypothetical protein TREMEDRAFT_61596 [Tremella mesenterica DSM 1558]|uniref:uncharacterized protein n=1 Tax=Tremella mesenterica (strain ATCC 24925 / CBS 8224 / DSM 1558 / NBRC 9311 / NRRL Y-6157 / RJB 2259-6 / UBC 559-6) TaxID=578456 RepID=UPI0003F4A389|nr:uncharacterized protein TREMEDRAFT_61596 [Tremella mesenterica DSM 1558]EIW69826.1 hypothetical protein TREMEDRAFT_61596 [Tremella mesenterica DSM 1558]